MSRIVLGPEQLAQFRDLTKSVEIGNVIGSFVPNAAFERIMAYMLPPATREEIEATRAEFLATGTLKDGVDMTARVAELKAAKREAHQ